MIIVGRRSGRTLLLRNKHLKAVLFPLTVGSACASTSWNCNSSCRGYRLGSRQLQLLLLSLDLSLLLRLLLEDSLKRVFDQATVLLFPIGYGAWFRCLQLLFRLVASNARHPNIKAPALLRISGTKARCCQGSVWGRVWGQRMMLRMVRRLIVVAGLRTSTNVQILWQLRELNLRILLIMVLLQWMLLNGRARLVWPLLMLFHDTH